MNSERDYCKYFEEISGKLTVLIKLAMRKDESFSSGSTGELIELLDGTGLSNEEIAEIGGVAPKTVANTKSKLKTRKAPKDGK